MLKLTYEESLEAAEPIKRIMKAVCELNVEYLTEALDEMKHNHSLRDAAAVLNPNPHIHNEQQDLNSAKIEQLELMLKLAKNKDIIIKCEQSLSRAKTNISTLDNLFNLQYD